MGGLCITKEKFTALIEAISGSDEPNKKDDLQVVEDFYQACGEYVQAVVQMEAAIITARDRMEGREYREYLSQLDNSRQHAHEALIASVKILERICLMYQVEPVYQGPTERVPIAEFAMQAVEEVFRKRKL